MRYTKAQVQNAIEIAVVVIVVIFVVLLALYLIGLCFGISLLNLLRVLAVPITVGAAMPLLNWLQKKRELKIADQRAEVDQEIADERRQDDTLQAYLDGMSQLLTDREQPLHSAPPGDSLSSVARARTLTVLGRLDGDRKRSVLQFLYEAGLIEKERTLLNESGLIERRHSIVSLEQANLRGVELSGAFLIEAELKGADLSEADLREAELRGARGWTEEQLSEAWTLVGATMPNGQKYEDWLKDKESHGEEE